MAWIILDRTKDASDEIRNELRKSNSKLYLRNCIRIRKMIKKAYIKIKLNDYDGIFALVNSILMNLKKLRK